VKAKYYISFNTKELPGAIKAVSVTLDNEIVTDMNKSMSVNLCEHPLYKNLEQYVKANPYRGSK
jgi:hypothetical protein